MHPMTVHAQEGAGGDYGFCGRDWISAAAQRVRWARSAGVRRSPFLRIASWLLPGELPEATTYRTGTAMASSTGSRQRHEQAEPPEGPADPLLHGVVQPGAAHVRSG